MVLQLPISPDVEAKLRAKAAAAGVDLDTYVARTLEMEAQRPAIDAVLAPVRAGFEASGMTEDELTDLLEEAKHELRSERRRRGQGR
jgi:hypothetical protein